MYTFSVGSDFQKLIELSSSCNNCLFTVSPPAGEAAASTTGTNTMASSTYSLGKRSVSSISSSAHHSLSSSGTRPVGLNLDIRPLTKSLDDLIDVLYDTDDLVTVTEYRAVVTRVALTFYSIKSYFQVLTKLSTITNKQAVIEKINYFLRILDEINSDQSKLHTKMIVLLKKLEIHNQIAQSQLINSIRLVVPMIGIELKIISILDQLLSSFTSALSSPREKTSSLSATTTTTSTTETSTTSTSTVNNSNTKSLIISLIKIFNEHDNNINFVDSAMMIKLTNLQILLEQDISIENIIKYILEVINFASESINVLKHHYNLVF